MAGSGLAAPQGGRGQGGTGAGSGEVFVISGGTDGAAFDLDDIRAGQGGFAILGDVSSDGIGFSIDIIGDVNADGFDDIAFTGSSFTRQTEDSIYVVYGAENLTSFDLGEIGAPGSERGFEFIKPGSDDFSPVGVSAAGDINGDGFADIAADVESAGGERTTHIIFGGDDIGVSTATAVGTEGDDILNGGAGSDRIVGDRGDDTINGGAGDDLLIGARGADVFVFADGTGDDKVGDFGVGDDILDVSAFGFANLADITAASTDLGQDLLIRLDIDDSLRLKEIDLSDLQESDFIF